MDNQQYLIPDSQSSSSRPPDTSRPGTPTSVPIYRVLGGPSLASVDSEDTDFVPVAQSDRGSSPISGATHRTVDLPDNDWDAKVDARFRVIERALGLRPSALGLDEGPLLALLRQSRNSLSAVAIVKQKTQLMVDIFKAKYIFLYGWCLLCSKVTNKKDKDEGAELWDKIGYIQLTGDSATKTTQQRVILAHQVAAILGEGIPLDESLEASHLCHNSVCVNPYHLCWESHQANESRKRCLVWAVYEDGGDVVYVNACKHSPRCIRTIPGVDGAAFICQPQAFIHNYNGDPHGNSLGHLNSSGL